MRFAPGQLIVRRHFQRGLLSRVWLGHVAADDDLGTWMWVASGSAYRDLGAADGRHLRQVNFREWPTMAKAFDERPWRGQVLMLHPREGEYSSWMFLDADYRVSRYYINLELPAVRWHDADTGLAGLAEPAGLARLAEPAGLAGLAESAGLAGLDTTDYDLDVIVHPDLTWEWKDEEEFNERLAYPEIYWVDDEAAVRAEGERIIKLAEAGQFPFDGTMTDYRPDPSWPIPTEMPPGWDRPSALG